MTKDEMVEYIEQRAVTIRNLCFQQGSGVRDIEAVFYFDAAWRDALYEKLDQFGVEMKILGLNDDGTIKSQFTIKGA